MANIDVQIKNKSISQMLAEKGLSAGGDVQSFHTNNVLRRMIKYMPYRSGQLIKLTIAQTDIHGTEIITEAPQARAVYHGKVMVDPKTGAAGFLTSNGWRSRRGVSKVPSNRNMVFTTTKNPQAGPYWDRRLMAAEGKAITQDLQRYINRR